MIVRAALGVSPGLRSGCCTIAAALASLSLFACGGGLGSADSDGPPLNGGACSSYYSCTQPAGTATEVSITNNCGGTESVSLSIVAGSCNDTVQPSCIQSLANGASGSVWLSGSNTANNFRVGAFGSSTLFEVTVNASGDDWYDISQNQGFDVGMTVVPPGGTVPYIVCTSQNCPGAYPFGDTPCDASPCLQPNYNAGATGNQFQLYLCNGWTGDPRPAANQNLNTPGPLGCSYNQGACIPPSSPMCPSGDTPDNSPADLPCQWGLPIPGNTNGSYGTCPWSC